MTPGSDIVVAIEKPVAGGRMLARYDGQIVLVAGTLPGERVRARVLSVSRGVAFGVAMEVIEPHPARRLPHRAGIWLDGPCGGSVYAHIRYEHQLVLKREIIADALARLGGISIADLEHPLDVAGSPERGYRLRARLHLRRGRVGFFHEGTHRLCPAAAPGQLSDSAARVVAGVARALAGPLTRDLDGDIELAENAGGSQVALHFEVNRPLELETLRRIAALGGVTGAGASVAGVYGSAVTLGNPHVVERLPARAPASQEFGDGEVPFVQIRRHVRSFFQGNRFLLPRLVASVHDRVLEGPVIDLYAGVGVFGVTLAAASGRQVVAVESEGFAAHDLAYNAAASGAAVEVRHQTVEEYLAGGAIPDGATLIVDPPRAGLSRTAAEGVAAAGAHRILYVSCDVATLARDARRLTSRGFKLQEVTAFDLFPNTAHVEAVAVFDRFT